MVGSATDNDIHDAPFFANEPVPEFEALDRELPVIRDDGRVSGFIRVEQKRGPIGSSEQENPNSGWHDHCPQDYETWLFDGEYDA